MNGAQEAKLANLNDAYGVKRWVQEGATVRVWTDDGDEAELYSDGTVNWKSVARGGGNR